MKKNRKKEKQYVVIVLLCIRRTTPTYIHNNNNDNKNNNKKNISSLTNGIWGISDQSSPREFLFLYLIKKKTIEIWETFSFLDFFFLMQHILQLEATISCLEFFETSNFDREKDQLKHSYLKSRYWWEHSAFLILLTVNWMLQLRLTMIEKIFLMTGWAYWLMPQ